MAIIEAPSICALCRPSPEKKGGSRRVIVAASIHSLLEDHGDLIRKNFTRHQNSSDKNRTDFAFTQSEEIWCMSDCDLHVFDGVVWHDATEALVLAGRRFGNVWQISAVGDDRVLVEGNSTKGKSYFGQFSAGEFKFSVAPGRQK